MAHKSTIAVKTMTHLSHRSDPGSQSLSSHIRSGSSPPCTRHCWGMGCSGTALEVLWSRKVWHPRLSGPQRCAGCLCSGRPWTSHARSPRNHSWAVQSTPRWETPGQRDYPANHPGTECHPDPGSHFHQEHYRGCVLSWPRWCLKGNKKWLEV